MDSGLGKKYNIKGPDLKPLNRSEGQKKYFFLDGRLYKVLSQKRAADILKAWDFTDNKIKVFILSDVKRSMKPAYDTVEVAQLLNRHRASIQNYVVKGLINSPVRIHEKGLNATGSSFTHMKWSEEDILALHECLLTIPGGRPRKDGKPYSGARLPSRKELLALMRQQPLFYMRTVDGEMVPIWSAYNGA